MQIIYTKETTALRGKNCDRSLPQQTNIKVLNIMTQATATKPIIGIRTCSTCPHFNSFNEINGRGWCNQFNHQAREYHEETNDCLISSEPVISHDLEDNLDLFPGIDFDELEAFPTEEIKDELDKPHSEYQVGSIIKVIDKDEHYTE